MNIVVLSDGFPTETHKMSGLFAFDQAKALKQNGENVFFACVNCRSLRHKNYPGIRKIEKDGMIIYSISIPLGQIPKNILTKIQGKAFEVLMRYIEKREGKIDLVHAHFYDMGLCAANNKSRFGYKYVLTEHFSGYIKNDKKTFDMLRKVYKKAYDKADALIAVGSRLAAVLEKEYKKNVMVIPNIVDTQIFADVVNMRDNNQNNNRFVSVGRLVQGKNMAELIMGFELFVKKYPNAELSIMGDGPEYGNLIELIKNRGLEKSIHLLGFCSREQIANEFQKANGFILVSEYETFGVVYIEALASGLPIITTKCGGPEDYFENEYGIMIDSKDKEVIYNALCEIKQKLSNYDSFKISKSIQYQFAPECIAKKLLTIYDNL